MRFTYEISRTQAATGHVTAESLDEARDMILYDLSYLDWDNDDPELSLWER